MELSVEILWTSTVQNFMQCRYSISSLPNTAGNWASLVAKGRKNPLEMQEMENRSPSWEVPSEEGMATHLSVLLASRIP